MHGANRLNPFYVKPFVEGGVKVCGIEVLGYFRCGFAVIFISKYSIAAFKVQAVCGNVKFHVVVLGEKIVVPW